MAKKVKILYAEPTNYFPEEILKECKLGRYSEEYEDEKENRDQEDEQLRKALKGE